MNSNQNYSQLLSQTSFSWKEFVFSPGTFTNIILESSWTTAVSLKEIVISLWWWKSFLELKLPKLLLQLIVRTSIECIALRVDQSLYLDRSVLFFLCIKIYWNSKNPSKNLFSYLLKSPLFAEYQRVLRNSPSSRKRGIFNHSSTLGSKPSNEKWSLTSGSLSKK